jgi:histidine triad (HIT) family protein
MDSVFTKIINGELPAHRLYDDDRCTVILDIRPVQPGHCLVIPKKQIEFIWDLDDDLYRHLWEVARKTARHMRETLQVNRVGVIIDGEAVPHVHIQLIPANGPHDLDAPRPVGEPDHIALRAMADKLRITN